MRVIITILFTTIINILGISTSLFAQIPNNFLTVRNLRTGATQQGTIEEAIFVARPQGIYMAVDVYLTISARGAFAPAQVNNNDLFEARLDFEQQVNAFSYDYWVFTDDKIIKADITDRYQANNLYQQGLTQSIGQQGVAILERNNNIKHTLRIFPLAVNGTRRIKISYLAIAAWSEDPTIKPLSGKNGEQKSVVPDRAGKVTAPLPAYIVYNGSRFLPKVEVRAFVRPEWGVPKLEEFPSQSFDVIDDPILGKYYKTEIDITNTRNALNITFSAPLQNGLYVASYKKDSVGFYQVIMLPELMTDVYTPKPRKVLLLFDFKEGNTKDIFQSDLINFTKAGVLNLFRQTDSLNIAYYTRLNARVARNHWTAATPADVDTLFQEVTNNWTLSASANLASTIGVAIQHFYDTNSEGDICIFSNTGQINSAQADNLIRDIIAAIGTKKINIHVYDSQNQNLHNDNTYFFGKLTQLTGGNYTNVWASNPAYNVNINTALESGLAIDGFTALQTSMNNGITYDLFNLKNELNQLIKFNEPIYQMGKFEGSGSFEVQISGKVEGNLFSRRTTTEPLSLDSVAQETWFGTHMLALTKIGQTLQAYNLSLEERILVNESAFLIQGNTPACKDCLDETKRNTTPVNDLPIVNDLNISAAPNPFSNEVKLSLHLPESRDWSDYHFGIYNLNGQLLQSFQSQRIRTDRLEFSWNPGENIIAGMYLFVVQSPAGQRSLKLIKL